MILEDNDSENRKFLIFGGIDSEITSQTFIFSEKKKDFNKSLIEECEEK